MHQIETMIRVQRLIYSRHTDLFKAPSHIRVCRHVTYATNVTKTNIGSSFRSYATGSSVFPNIQNELAKAQSPFLKSQANSLVAWQEWNPKVLELAASYNRPIFLSIGFQACHWNKVMEKESFNDREISNLINSNFVPIRVDRDERRDIDLLYTMYYEATTGQSGWPLNVFLDPNSLAPFFGGNYWPSSAAISATPTNPQQKDSTPASFEAVLSSVSDAWKNSQEKCVDSANAIKERLTELYRLQNGAEKSELKLSVFDDVGAHFRDHFDVNYGGFTKSPKFLLPHNLAFLLKYSDLVTPDPAQDTRPSYQKTHTFSAKEMASMTLKKMGEGAIKDQIGHGFHHYSVTDDWSLPKFEKLLIDQALMLNAYVYAYQADPVENKFALEYIQDLVMYMSRDLTDGGLKTKQGGLILSEDADSIPAETAIRKYTEEDDAELDKSKTVFDKPYKPYEKIEGAYYFWQYEDFAKPLNKMEVDIAEAYYNVKEMGNINEEMDTLNKLAYQNTLFRSMPLNELAQYFGISVKQAGSIIYKTNEKLRAYRKKTRDHPLKDDRIFAGYNGAAITALANASIALGATDPNPRVPQLAEVGKSALQNAKEIADFVYNNLYDKSTSVLTRYYLTNLNGDSGIEGPSKVPGTNDDYAYMIQGLLALYSATFDTFYLDFAKSLQDAQFVKLWDTSNGAFFFSDSESAQKSKLFLRFKHSFDSAEPSSNGISCENLLKLSGLLHDGFYSEKAAEILECYGKDVEAQPFGYCSMLGSVVTYLKRHSAKGSLTTVLVVGGESEAGQESEDIQDSQASSESQPTCKGNVEEQLFRVQQLLFNSLAVGSLTAAKINNTSTDSSTENGNSDSVSSASTHVPNLMPNLALLRLRQKDMDKYYEPYGNTLYGALVDKYATGKLKFFVVRNSEVSDPVESLEELSNLVFKS